MTFNTESNPGESATTGLYLDLKIFICNKRILNAVVIKGKILVLILQDDR